MDIHTDKQSSVLAANQGDPLNLPAHRGDRTLRSMIAGYFNATSGLAVFTAPVTGISVVGLPALTGSSTAKNTSTMTSSTPTVSKPHRVSVVTVTDRTTVTETSCSTDPTSTKSLETVSTLPTSLIVDDIVKSMVPATPNVPKATSVSAVKNPGTRLLPSAFGNEQTSQTVLMITKTAWTTTWTSVTAQPSVPVSSSVKGVHSSVHENPIDGKSQQPIDQAYAKPVPPPTTAPAMTTTSCTSNGTNFLGLAGKTSAYLEVTSPLPTIHTGLPVFGTAGTKSPKVSQSSHPVPKIPMIPNLPIGHPPLFSNGTLVRNHTTSTFYHEKPTVHPGAASVSKHHVPGSSTSHQAAKCTTTFKHAPTQACTSTSYVHTKTIAVDCYGCVGEQAQVTDKAYHEGKV